MDSKKFSRQETDRFVELNGVKVHYNEMGHGPALLCFHGGGPGANAWDNTKHNIDVLSEHFRLLLVDLPGYGLSDKEAKLNGQPLDVYWARIVRDLRDHAGIDRAHLYGSSQSGPMCLRFGIEYPDRTGKLILQSSGGSGLVLSPTPPEGIKALSVFAENPVRENMVKMMQLFVPRAERLTEEMIDARFQAALIPGHLEARREFSASKNSDITPDLPRLQAPVMLVWGHQDRMVPFEGAFSGIWRIPNAQTHIWGGGTGHFVEYEQADEFNALTMDFLLGDDEAATTHGLTEASTSRFADVEGMRLHYNEAGSGPVIVMLHGGGPGASGWSNFQRNVSVLSQHYRVLLPDMPGFGKSDSVTLNEPRSQANARAIRGLLDALRIERATLIGNSMGGATSVNFAIDYSDRVDKLVLMGSGGGGQPMFTPAPSEGIKVLNQVFENPTAEGMRRLIELMVYDSSFLTDELLQQRLGAALNPGHLEARRNSSPVQRDVVSQLGKIKAKTLIVWGRDDRVVPIDGGLRLLAGIPDTRLHVFSKCGHWAQFEHAGEFNRLVLDFLALN